MRKGRRRGECWLRRRRTSFLFSWVGLGWVGRKVGLVLESWESS